MKQVEKIPIKYIFCLAAGQTFNTRGAWLRSLIQLEILVSEFVKNYDIFDIQTHGVCGENP